jgi:TonB family protein
MPKRILALVFCLFLFTEAFAQKGGLIYYLKNSGKLVSTKDSADYSMVVLPPDTSVDKKLYVVYEYYPNGKVKLVTNSKTNDINLQYEGRYIGYFPNGRKKSTGRFENGNPIGHEVEYYPNGKIYIIKNYLPDGKAFFGDCRDSLGNVLTENGNGKWVQYNSDFTKITAEGNVENGKEEGEWHGSVNANVNFKSLYHQGDVVSSDAFDRPGADSAFTKVDVVPGFPGGLEEFAKFLGHNTRYPVDARQQGIQGKVTISFIVETDGTLTNLKISKGVDKIIDDEALIVMKLSPPWNPGLVNGKPVRVSFSVPITFALSN